MDFPAKTQAELPIFCHPIALFLGVWLLMLLSLVANVSEETFTGVAVPLGLCVISVSGFFAGYWIYCVLSGRQFRQRPPADYWIDVPRLRRVNLTLLAAAAAIVLLNIALEGPPPIAGTAFGVAGAALYSDYGRLKQLLFPLVIAIFVNSNLESSKMWRLAILSVSTLIILSYVTRGNLLQALIDSIFVFALTTRWSKKKIAFVAILAAVVAATAMNLIGNNRGSNTEQDFAFLAIRPPAQLLPKSYIWAASYVSVPFSNLCWVVDGPFRWSHGLYSLHPIVPSFLRSQDAEAASLAANPHLIDGVHTYLMDVYLDFWYFGIVGANVAIGWVSAWFVRRGIQRQVLTYAVFMGCIAMMFFTDYFVALSTLVLFAIEFYVQKSCITSVYVKPVLRSELTEGVAIS